MKKIGVFQLLPAFLIFFLAACGGGGGGGESTSSPSSAPIVTSVAATSIDENSATLNGTVNPNGLSTQVWFDYGTDSGLQTYSSSPNQDAGNGLSPQAINTTLNGLATGTTYYFRICAENSKGYLEAPIISFTTASPGSPPAVATVTATSVGATGATLNGSVIPNGLVTTVWFEWGTDSALISSSSTPTQSVGSGTTSQLVNAALTGLTTGTTYYYRVAASNSSGTTKGNILSFLPGAVPAVRTLGATSIGATGATLNGSVLPNGLATNAWFEWGTALSTLTSTSSQSVGSGTTSLPVTAELTGLSTGTTYYFRVAASNASGTTRGSILSFTTASPGDPPTVTTIAATSVGATGATLNGSVTPNGLPTSAWFEWGTDSSLASYSTTATQAVGSGSASQTINQGLTGLSTETTYYYRVAASNSQRTTNGLIESFTTTSSSPSFGIVSTTPANNATEIPIANTMTVTFNQDVDIATLSSGITVSSFIGPLPGSISYNSSTKTAIITPSTPFAPLTEYTVTVATTVKSASGEFLSAPYTFRFETITAFWVNDFTVNQYYLMGVNKVAEGEHCYIYLENGKNISQTNINTIKDEFDNLIYPNIRTYFGNEPDPGADGLSKVSIVLLDIRDGYVLGFGYIAGYFHSLNEYSNVDTYPVVPSNQKEVFFMDISPGNPSSSSFYQTLAHEFQHMVHWEQKYHQLGLYDPTWLNEAMSEIAPFYVGYGPAYGRVSTFEAWDNRSDSLTVWNGGLADYAVVYMWSQYMADRFPTNAFKNILVSPTTGIASVESYLNANYPGETFSTVFRDWSIAVFSGNEISWTGHPEWSYKTINTWQGIYDGIPLAGQFTPSNRNISLLPSLAPWSIDNYWYTPQSENPTFTLNVGPPPIPQASFINLVNDVFDENFDMIPGQAYAYDNAAYLILQNASEVTTSSSSTTNLLIQSTPTTILTPMEKLHMVSESIAAKRLRETTGEPIGICIHDYLLEQEKVLRDKIQRKQHEQ